ncbi:SH3 domain-containing protein [Pseudoflavitalea sp. X16]|uniref:SH3 domain-containing protein n=1 Tax=Paraflavitalea devenefica TaxID=2716334 RepID=UPI001422F4BA|nr:SH3 domain-containing protein [Paraflavitalea devenefica]NII28219.1 SH3 domain-containing protein [Paraflavitalea devenefica]
MKYVFAFVLVVNSLLAAAQSYRYPPRNEVSKDSSLKVFVDTLKAVVARKDAPALLKLLSPTVQVTFEDTERKEDSHNNVKGFKEMYAPQYPSSQVWKNLHTVISLGGVFGGDQNGFVFPYASQMEIRGKEDYCSGCGECLTIIAPDVNVRKSPDRLSAALGRLNYDVVKVIEEPVSKVFGGKSDNWVYIQTFDGKLTGWVRNDLTWDICDYRLLLEKKKGKWQIAAFIAGD